MIRIFFFALFTIVFGCGAATYTLERLAANDIHLTYRLDDHELRAPKPLTLHFALTMKEGVACRGRLFTQNDNSGSELNIEQSGWFGKDYLQWFSVSLGAPNADLHPRGTIRIQTGRAVFSPTREKIEDRNGILHLPLQSGFAKTVRHETPEAPFRVGLRMSIDREGIYKITGRQLQQAGVPLSKVNTHSFRLFNRGKELAMYVNAQPSRSLAPDDYVVFYAKPLRGKTGYLDQYARAEVYWLVWELGGVALRVAEVSGARKREDVVIVDSTGKNTQIKASEFPDTLHYEKDSDIRWLGSIYDVEQMSQNPVSSDSVDNWYWGFIGDKELTEYTINVPGPSRNQNHRARLRIGFMGLSSNNSVPNDHMLEVLLNDDQLGSQPQIASWDGQNTYVFESDHFPAGILREGENRIVFRRPDRSFVDRTALNWIELEYVRDFRAFENSIFFRSSPQDTNGLFQFNVRGFDSPDITLFDITHNRIFTRVEITPDSKTGKYDLVFQDSIIGPTKYAAVSRSRQLFPAALEVDTIKGDWLFPNVNYIMLTVDSLKSTLEPLAALHEQRGLKTEIISIQDIYNSFSYGIQDPASIQKMIQHVSSTQTPLQLKYVLLAGDGTHDHYKQREHLTLVPTHLSRVPGWGPAADDGFFVTVRGNDNFPDLAIGRLPARDKRDLQTMVEKTINYIRHPERGFWRDNLLLAGGYEPDFTSFNNRIQSDIVGQHFNILRMDADPKSPYFRSRSVAASRMADAINAGVYILNFAGHGGGNVWSDSRFFSYEDLPRLHNSQWRGGGRLPIIFSFTCLTGFFESVFYKSLGEEFLRNSSDGAIAFYGAAAYTRKDIDLKFNHILLETLVNGSSETLGDLIRHAELLALVKYNFQALPVIRQYNLLGDPALPLRSTPDSLEITLEKSFLENRDTLHISGTAPSLDTATVRVTISAENTLWKEVLLPVSNGRFSYSFPLKQSARTAEGIVRACAWTDSRELVGWSRFSKDTVSLAQTNISPAFPALGDSVVISCLIAAPDSIIDPQIVCLYTVDAQNASDLDFEKHAPIRMEKDSLGYWQSMNPIVIKKSPDIPYSQTTLYVKFRILNGAGETAVKTFQLKAQPDLTFTRLSSTKLFWHDDSLRATVEILNQGNAVAPPFELALFQTGGTENKIDSAFVNDSLLPGTTVSHTFTIPDTAGIFQFSAYINKKQLFTENEHTNNVHSFTDTLRYADIHFPSDTLLSAGKGFAVTGNDTLSRSYRLFLFSHPLPATPLSTSSQWLDAGEDGKSGFRVRTRPRLDSSDSLYWHITDPGSGDVNGLSKHAAQSLTSSGSLFYFDSLSSTWRAKLPLASHGAWLRSEPTWITGPFAFGTAHDTAAPHIQAHIGGKEIHSVDYTPRNKPFTFIITDPSGIDRQSLSLSLNGDSLDSKFWSGTYDMEDLTSMTVTALPPAIQQVDSLTVTAVDMAGNRAQKTFAYLPGEKLSIKFFSCHPNPFTGKSGKKIRFAFVLTDIADDVSISIFTIASRKVASFDLDPNRIGYQELAWDGLTDTGYRLANGTYYAKLTARNKQRTVKKIIRIVKLEGF